MLGILLSKSPTENKTAKPSALARPSWLSREGGMENVWGEGMKNCVGGVENISNVVLGGRLSND